MKGGPRIRLPSVEIAARYAGFVLQHSGTTYHDITEARAILEAHCVALLAEHRTDGQLQALRASLVIRAQQNVEQAARSYAEFHTLVAELAGKTTRSRYSPGWRTQYSRRRAPSTRSCGRRRSGGASSAPWGRAIPMRSQ